MPQSTCVVIWACVCGQGMLTTGNLTKIHHEFIGCKCTKKYGHYSRELETDCRTVVYKDRAAALVYWQQMVQKLRDTEKRNQIRASHGFDPRLRPPVIMPKEIRVSVDGRDTKQCRIGCDLLI